MTKEKLIDLCRHYFAQVDKTSSYHPVVVEYTLGRVINTILYDAFRNNISNLDLYTKRYDGVPVTKSGNRYTSELPASIVQFPGVGDGVRGVYAAQDSSLMFYPSTMENAARMSYMEFVEVSTDVAYVVANTTVEFIGIPSEVTVVSMDLVRPFEAYADEEEFYVPAGQDEPMFRMAMQYLSGVMPPDLRNDNNGVRR